MRPNQHDASAFTLTEAEAKRLVSAGASFRNRVILETLYLTGMRREELCHLSMEDVDWGRQRIVIRNGKGGKRRVVPMAESLGVDLRALAGRRSTGPLFLSQKGGKLSPRTLNYLVAAAGERAGIRNPNPSRKGINPHLLRHTFARHYLKHGGTMHRLSQILGHASVAITHAVYGTASEEEIQEEYNGIVTRLGAL